jgi:hypothetical protein
VIIVQNVGIAGVFRLELALCRHRTSHPAPFPSFKVRVSSAGITGAVCRSNLDIGQGMGADIAEVSQTA